MQRRVQESKSPRVIEAVNAGEVLRFENESIIVNGNVAGKANITVVDGNLHIKGSVGNDTQICIATNSPYAGNVVGMMVINGMVVNGTQAQVNGQLIIEGNVGDKAAIQGLLDVIVQGDIGSNAKITGKNGNISVRDVSSNARLRTTNGNIECHKLSSGASLSTTNGSIHCDAIDASASVQTTNGSIKANSVGENASLSTTNGSIKVAQAHASAELDTVNGSVTVAGVKRQKPGSGANVVINGVTFSGGNIFSMFNNGVSVQFSPGSSASQQSTYQSYKF